MWIITHVVPPIPFPISSPLPPRTCLLYFTTIFGVIYTRVAFVITNRGCAFELPLLSYRRGIATLPLLSQNMRNEVDGYIQLPSVCTHMHMRTLKQTAHAHFVQSKSLFFFFFPLHYQLPTPRRKGSRHSSCILLSGGSPTSARNTFLMACPCRFSPFTTGVPSGTRGAFSK